MTGQHKQVFLEEALFNGPQLMINKGSSRQAERGIDSVTIRSAELANAQLDIPCDPARPCPLLCPDKARPGAD